MIEAQQYQSIDSEEQGKCSRKADDGFDSGSRDRSVEHGIPRWFDAST